MSDSQRTRAIRALVALAAMFVLAQCAQSSQAQPEGDASAFTSHQLTADDIRNAGVLGGTLFDAVQRLRPGFLIDRTAGPRRTTQPIQVSVNRGQLSPISTLNSIPAATVQEVRYLTLGEASQQFGARASGPVILVTLSTRVPAEPA